MENINELEKALQRITIEENYKVIIYQNYK